MTDSGRVRSANIRSIELDGNISTPNEDEQFTAVVAKNALEKSRYKITSGVNLPQLFQIDQTLKIPANLCVE